MTSIIHDDGSEEPVSGDDARVLADAALGKAIAQIAKAQWAAAKRPKGRPGRPAFVAKGDEVRRLVQARSDVLGGKITPEQAMAMLHEPDVFRARFSK
jgi:hypothetical protein